LLDRNIT